MPLEQYTSLVGALTRLDQKEGYKLGKFIDLDRRFSRQAEDRIQSDDVEHVPETGTLSWTDLLESKRVILLAGARSGKTEELRQAVERLRAGGKPAYFIPLNELAQSDLAKQCAPFEDEFKRWQSDAAGGPAWFMVDARDELAVSGRHLRIALTNLRQGLDLALSRAHVILSSRPSDWHPASDLQDFKKILSVPPQQIAIRPGSPVASSDATLSTRSEEESETPQGSLLLVKMALLSDAAVIKLSKAWGVVDEEEFRIAVERSDVTWLARRPGDLQGLVRLWLAEGALGTYEKVLKAIIDQSLDESREIPDPEVDLTRNQCRAGVVRLAAALAWCQSHAYIQEEDVPQTVAGSAIVAGQVFPDHPRALLRALLRTAFFDGGHYGYVRFHSRPTREFLAADWVNGMELSGGLSQREIHNLVFRRQYGELLVIPALRPVAAWLALRHRSVRELVYKIDPAILLTYGDPAQLPTALKQELLASTINYALEHGTPASDPRPLRALGGVEMIPAIRGEWERLMNSPGHSSRKFTDDARMVVLSIIELGRHRQHVDIALAATTTIAVRSSLQMSALGALLAIGVEEEIQLATKRVLGALKKHDRRFLMFAAQRLYPKYLTTLQLLDILKVKDPEEEGINLEPKWSIGKIIESTEEAKKLEEILRGLGSLSKTEVSAAEDKNPAMDHHTAIRWIPSSIIEVTEKLLRINPDVQFSDDSIVAMLWAVQRSDTNAAIKSGQPLIDKIALGYGRERLAWLAVRQFDSWYRSYGVQMNALSRLYLVEEMIHFGPGDLDWILSPLSQEPKDLRVLAAVQVWRRAEQGKAEIMARLRTFAGADKDLVAMIDSAENPAPIPESSENLRQARKWRRQRKTQEKREQAAWTKLKEDLRANPAVLAAPDLTTTEAQFTRLWSMRYVMEKAKGDASSVFSLDNWQDIVSEFGKEVGQAAIVGFKNYWRAMTSELPSELAPNARNSTKYYTLISLAGLGIEASLDPEWSSRLTRDEAVKALRHGIRELNGFPPWFAKVARRHTAAAFDLLEREIRAELVSTDNTQHPNTLSRLAYEPHEELAELPSLILKCLKTEKITNDKAFEYAIDILARAKSEEAGEVVRFVKQQLRLKSLGVRKKAEYLFVVLCIDLTDGEASLRKVIEATPKKDRPLLVQRTIARISGERRHESISIPMSADIGTLKRLVDLSFRYILRAKDVEHKGVFSPGLRDHAQNGRNLLVRALMDAPGREAYQALIDLSKKPHMRTDSVWLVESARQKARDDADKQARWVAGDIPAYEEARVREPRNNEQLLEVALRRLEEIGDDLRNGDFSLKDLLDSKASKEVHCQRWLAEQLRLRAKGLYSVAREPAVVNEKKPDIVLRGRFGAFSLPIEVKVANGLVGRKLREALFEQLIGRYMLDQSSTHGVLVIFGKDRSRAAWELGGRRTKSLTQLASMLDGMAGSHAGLERKGMAARVVALDLG